LARRDEPVNPFTKKPGHSAPRFVRPERGDSRPKRAPNAAPPPPPGARKPAQAPPPPGRDKATPEKVPDSKPPARGTPASAGGRRSVGLRPEKPKVRVEKKEAIPAEQASKILIEQSKVKASPVADEVEAATVVKEDKPARPALMPTPVSKRPTPEQRRQNAWRKRNRPRAPAKRVKKLHRGKYMEFKYDVRKILDEEEVADEFRSNILGRTWAKGERIGVEDAKLFLLEKVAAGELSEKAAARIKSLIKSLTTRR